MDYLLTLSFFNQIEMVLLDLPNSIAKLFLVNEVMTKSKAEILDFCVTIQDMVQSMWENDKRENENSVIDDPVNEMEVFTFNPELETESVPVSPMHPSSSGTGNTGVTKKARPCKKRKLHASELDDSDDSSRSSKSSTSDMPVDYAPKTERGGAKVRGVAKVRGAVRSRGISKRGRGRPRKTLAAIQEVSSDSIAEYLNEISDASSTTSMRVTTH